MTRYKLPASLGGIEVELVTRLDNNLYSVTVPAGGPQFDIHPNWLTEVPPPIPDEPEPGAYLIGEKLCVRWPNEPGRRHYWNYADREGGFQEVDEWSELWDRLGGPGISIVSLVPKADLPDYDGQEVAA